MTRDVERIRQETIRDIVSMIRELFDDTDLLSVDSHPALPAEVLKRVHDAVRAAIASGCGGLEVRTWTSELQITCGDQGESWIKPWPAEDVRVRHVQLLDWLYEDDERRCVVLWETPQIDIRAM